MFISYTKLYLQYLFVNTIEIIQNTGSRSIIQYNTIIETTQISHRANSTNIADTLQNRLSHVDQQVADD